jgi:hypothetical protein
MGLRPQEKDENPHLSFRSRRAGEVRFQGSGGVRRTPETAALLRMTGLVETNDLVMGGVFTSLKLQREAETGWGL